MVKLHLSSEDMGKLIGISGRSFRDWISEKTLGTKHSMSKLSRLSHIPLPRIVEERQEFWSGKAYGKQAALVRFQLYGPPGTPEGRKKGGRISQEKRKAHPELYPKHIRRNTFKTPSRLDPLLSEFVGIVLGDGGITRQQVHITLNAIADQHYVPHVRDLIYKLFGYRPSLFLHKQDNGITVVITGVDFIEYLVQLGLKIGNKVKQQVDVPDWIKANPQLSKACLRGLMDTDGGIFTHRYKVNKKLYSYLKLCFSNMSIPLKQFVYNTLLKEGFTP